MSRFMTLASMMFASSARMTVSDTHTLAIESNVAGFLNSDRGVASAMGASGLKFRAGTFANRDGGELIVHSSVILSPQAVLVNGPRGPITGYGILNVAQGQFSGDCVVAPGLGTIPGTLTVVVGSLSGAATRWKLKSRILQNGDFDQLAVRGDVQLHA